MASELTIGLVIGASLRGFGAAFGQATRAVTQLDTRIGIAHRQQERLGRSLSRAFSDSTRNVGQLRQRYQQLGEAITRAERSQRNLNKAIAAQQTHTANRRKLQGEMFETGMHAMAFARPLVSSVKTFMDQEEAANNLKIAMMRADGSIGAFEEIGKIASQLGTDLPGTRKDFYNLALALKKQGVSDDIIKKGGLATAAKLNVLLDMDQFEGGEFLAKFMESHGLKEDELEKSADYLQRAMYAAGLNKSQMYESMKYYAPKLNSLGLTGAENTEQILAIEGIAGQKGLEGSTFGTGLNMMLTRMNKGPEMMKMATKGMKAEAQDMLKDVGVSFDFWDKKGKFKGIEGMLTEMEKFEKIRAKYGDKGVDLVANEMFGIEGGRLADILAQKGKKGLEEMLTKMREQASLQERIAQKTKTLGAALEALGGVWESAVGTFGSAFADDIKAFAKEAQGFIENVMTPWIEKNKGLIKTVVSVVGGFLAAKIGILGASYALNLFLSPFKAIAVASSKISAVFNMMRLARFGGAATSITKLGKAFSVLKNFALTAGKILSGAFVKAITMAGKAFMWLGRALLMNPIGLAITAIALGAYLIYQYWEPIKGFFINLWQTIKPYFDNFCQFVSNIWRGITGIWSSAWTGVTSWFTGLWDSLKSLFNGNFTALGSIILAFNPLALFTTIFNSVLNWFGIDLPAKFSDFGQNIIDGLVNGISNAWNLAKEKVSELGSGIKGWFAEKLGIHSPSVVFKGYGVNVVEGLAIGMDKAQPLAEKATDTLSSAVHFEDKKQDGLFAHYQPLSRENVSQSQLNQTQGAITVHFNPTITVTGGQEQSLVGQIQQALLQNSYEFEQMLKRVLDQQQRLAY